PSGQTVTPAAGLPAKRTVTVNVGPGRSTGTGASSRVVSNVGVITVLRNRAGGSSRTGAQRAGGLRNTTGSHSTSCPATPLTAGAVRARRTGRAPAPRVRSVNRPAASVRTPTGVD